MSEEMILVYVEIFLFLRGDVLFLKKVHSWEGVTEMVLGLFLLVL